MTGIGTSRWGPDPPWKGAILWEEGRGGPLSSTRTPPVQAALLESAQSRKPSVEAALVVTYLQFPIQVC